MLPRTCTMIVPIPMDLLFSLAFIVVLSFNAPFHHRLNLNAIKLAAKVRISLSLFASIFPLCISSGIPGFNALFFAYKHFICTRSSTNTILTAIATSSQRLTHIFRNANSQLLNINCLFSHANTEFTLSLTLSLGNNSVAFDRVFHFLMKLS